jgi:hypothetical protein
MLRWRSRHPRTSQRRGGAAEPATLVTMITQAERAAAKRKEKLEEIERQVKEGSLKIRKLTAKERKRFPPRPRKEPAKGARR